MGTKRNDILWKGVMEDFFDEFLHFFFPRLIQEVDFSKDFQFLEQEIAELFPEDDPEHPRVVDKLVKVHFKTDEPKWFLVHIEIQGYRQADFAARMFRYFYRLYDRFKTKVLPVVIFLNKSTRSNRRPFVYRFEEANLTFDFKRYYIGDQSAEALAQLENPFALIIHTALTGLSRNLKDEELFQLKFNLVKRLYSIDLSKEKIRRLLAFINGYLHFESREQNIKFVELTQKLTTKNTSMGVIEQLREMDLKKGEKKAALRIAKKMLQDGVKSSAIRAYTGVSLSELRRIAKELSSR